MDDYYGGTSDEDFNSNIDPSNDTAPDNWYQNTYGQDNMSFGGGQQSMDVPQFDFNNSIPEGTWQMPQQQQFGFGGNGVGIQPGQAWEGMGGGGFDMPDMGKYGDVLSNLFNNKGFVTGLGALMEGRQNKQSANNTRQIVQQQQQRLSPFDTQSTGATQMGASSMRDAMQQKLAAAMQDPYGQPIVKSQTDAIQQAQAIKDAAAGRRSNMATSSPAMLAAQAQVAQNYMNSLYNPAGAGINPNSQGLEALLSASKQGTNGYASPLMSALGYNMGTNGNNSNMQNQMTPQLLQALQAFAQKSGGV